MLMCSTAWLEEAHACCMLEQGHCRTSRPGVPVHSMHELSQLVHEHYAPSGGCRLAETEAWSACNGASQAAHPE